MKPFDTLKKARSEERYPSIAKRLKVLRALREAILTHKQQIVEAVKQDYYRPTEEVLMTELIPVISELNHLIRKLKSWAKPKRVRGNPLMVGTQAEVFCEPRGLVLVMSPWNYPFQLSAIPLAQAIGAGNRVILKPSEHSPALGAMMQTLFEPLLPNFCRVVTGDIEVGKQLLDLPFDHFFFTGSPRVGKIVMQKAAEHHASVTLELGGKSPAIVGKGANLNKAAKKIAWGKWLNAGQTCIAPDYVLVHQQDYEPLKSKLLNAAKMFDGPHYAHTQSGERKAPELIGSIGETEIFGPTLPVVPYQSFDQMAQLINAHPNPLACYHFPGEEDYTAWLAESFPSGSLVIDDTLIQASHPGLPFGGVGMSGLGRYHGEAGFKEFSHEKSVLRRTFPGLVSWFYPPYTRFHKRALNLLLSRFSRFI